ncbi:MAG: hypothetical protein ACF8R7_16770 [Phycisphaerales bacterium JB039]
MSIRFVRDPNQLQIESLRADDGAGGDLAPTLPLTALVWLRFESVPGASETWAVWWYGERARAINALTLYAQRSTGNKLELAAKLVGVTGSVTATSAELDTEEWHQVAVVLKPGVSEGDFVIELHVDDLTVVNTTASATISESDWGALDRSTEDRTNATIPSDRRARIGGATRRRPEHPHLLARGRGTHGARRDPLRDRIPGGRHGGAFSLRTRVAGLGPRRAGVV